ncbi:MAG: glycosyltransferase family 9 protein [Stenotrophobium sp.]
MSALGDVVLVVPAVRALAVRWPQARIVWITGRGLMPILGSLPDNVELLPIRKPKKWGDYRELSRRLKGERFDALLAMQASFRANLVYPLIKARRKIGYDRRLARELHGSFVNERIERQDHHLLDDFMSFAQMLGVPAQEPQWNFRLDAAACEWLQQQLTPRRYIALNLLSSKPQRNWPLARSIEVAQWAVAHGWRVAIIGGGSDAERNAADAVTAVVPDTVNFTGQTDLPRLFALLAQAAALVSPDSGPVHIARAFEVPVVGLYACARAEKTGPYQRLQWTVDRYPQAALQFLGKPAGSLDWHRRIANPLAMELITVADVVAKLEQALALQSP